MSQPSGWLTVLQVLRPDSSTMPMRNLVSGPSRPLQTYTGHAASETPHIRRKWVGAVM